MRRAHGSLLHDRVKRQVSDVLMCMAGERKVGAWCVSMQISLLGAPPLPGCSDRACCHRGCPSSLRLCTSPSCMYLLSQVAQVQIALVDAGVDNQTLLAAVGGNKHVHVSAST